MPGTVIITGAKGGLASRFVSSYAAAHPSDHVLCLLRDARDYAPLPSPSDPHAGATIEHVSCDLSDLLGVRAAARAICERVERGEIPRVFALVCQASAQRVAGLKRISTRTRGGEVQVEETILANHLGHLALILEVLPAMQEAGQVVIFGAEAHRPDYKFFKRTARYQPLERLVDGELEGEGDERDKGLERYSTSKLVQLMMGYELARRLNTPSSSPLYRSLRVILYNPGTMAGTGLFRQHPIPTRTVMQASLAFPAVSNTLEPELGASTPEAAAALLQRVLEGDVPVPPAGEGAAGVPYYDYDGEVRDTHADARDEGRAREMWDDSVRFLGMEEV